MKFRENESAIKHSLPTAFRQAVSKLETQRHRLGVKRPPPAGRLKCGLLGTGRFFNYAYVPALNKKNSPLAVTRILTRDEARFLAVQKNLRHQAKPVWDTEVLLASGIDAALILLPNQLHFKTARKALEHGLHVFCEKPLTNTVAEAQTLKTVAQKSGRVLMTSFNQRFSDRNRVLKQLIVNERVGKITSVRAFHNQNLTGLQSFAALHKNVTGGGVVHNAGIHFLNLFLHWFGDVEKVRGVFENRALPPDCGEDTAHCELWFRSGVKATLDASLANAVDTTYERVELSGERGVIASDLKKCDIVSRLTGKPSLKIPCRTEIISDSVFNALEHFADCVARTARPETDIDDFIRTMKTVAALTLSAQRGEEVSWAEIESQHAH